MDKLTVGILAHVDAGKTTLSEALLYRGGALRKLGRVDHADAFLDTDALERERGITIFSKQAVLPLKDIELTLLDTPGHVDFSAEAERTLCVLDCAILVVSGPDGPQGHTLTLWKLLERHGVPVFLFLNKMDQPGTDRAALMDKLHAALSPAVLDWASPFQEEAALGDEESLEEYMERGDLSDDTLRRLIGERKIFPCLFGSALKVEGVDELLEALSRYAPPALAGQGLCRPGLQDFPGPPGGQAHPYEDYGRLSAGPLGPAHGGGDGEGGGDSCLLRGQVYACGGGPGGHGLRR